jgi:hypothetical protein
MISSRTPEGDRQRCPLCGQLTRIEPSTFPTRDATCPRCGQWLLFAAPGASSSAKKSSRATYEGFFINEGQKRLGPLPVALQSRLFAAVRRLAGQNRLPGRDLLRRVLENARHWDDVVYQFEWGLPGSRRGTRAYRAGAWLRRASKLLLKS